MEQIYIYTATTKKEYTWYQFNSENGECLINIQPSYWELIQRYLPPGGHLPGLSILSDRSKGITLCISGIKSHRLEKHTSQIVDTILISNSISKLSNTQLVLIQKFLEATPISIDIDDPFITSTYSEWFTKLSECITNNGEGGALGIDFDFEKFKKIISESSVSIQDSQSDTSNLEEDTESEVALDTLENRLVVLKNLSKYAYNNNFPISLLITYGINPKELERIVFKGLTVHSKAKTDLSGQDVYEIPPEKDGLNPDVAHDQIAENIIEDEGIEKSADDHGEKYKGHNSGNAREQATQIEVDTNKVLGIAVTSAGVVISLFHGKITIITSIITGAGVYLYSKRKKIK
jgi:hypothetical protein